MISNQADSKPIKYHQCNWRRDIEILYSDFPVVFKLDNCCHTKTKSCYKTNEIWFLFEFKILSFMFKKHFYGMLKSSKKGDWRPFTRFRCKLNVHSLLDCNWKVIAHRKLYSSFLMLWTEEIIRCEAERIE